ncbi:MAG TPA: hypothetical protein ENN99_10590 [Chloroflexi bacterium]|nr:hypothetical protein [Chloroflexota bacterium]
MKNISGILLAITILALVTLACGGSDTATPAAQTAAVPPTTMPTNTPRAPTQAPEPQPAEEMLEGATIEITNQSGIEIWYIQISPSKSEQWGDDWLGENVIANGQTHVIAGIPEGQYDVRALDREENPIEIWWNVDLEGEMTWTITGLASLEIINSTADTIAYLYISPTDADSWGDDWLGEDVIGAGGSYVVADIPPGTYDVKAADMEDLSIEVIYNVEMSGSRNWTVVGKTDLPSNAVLRFEEDFGDNRNNWGSSAEGENVFYRPPADGEYCITIKTDNYTAMEWYEPFTTDEFVAEVACTIYGAEDPSCGLGFGPNIDNIYWFEISPYDQTFALFLRENGEWQDNLIGWTTSRNISPSRMNYLSLQRVDGIVSLFINGVLVSEASGERFPTGRVGIGGSTYSEANANICLDNLRVWRLE